MTRKDMIKFIVCYCNNCDNCLKCPVKLYCIGLSKYSEETGVPAFTLMTDAEVRDMYLKCCVNLESRGTDNDKKNQ